MQLDELREKRAKLEKDITELLKSFERDTLTAIEDIDLIRGNMEINRRVPPILEVLISVSL